MKRTRDQQVAGELRERAPSPPPAPATNPPTRAPAPPATSPPGGHSHTLFYGPMKPASQPQTPGTPPNLFGTTVESTPVYGPYATSLANGAKTVYVTQALCYSR